jgi:predicted ATPase/DNA-binding winged helix-turn-helix (wHTH) protein
MQNRGSTEYRFGSFRLLPVQRQLFDAEAAVKVGGRAFDLLLTLVEHRERPVSKRELMERVWPNLVVEENNLQVQIVALRKALGQGAIATIPGRGYQFTQPIEVAEPTTSIPRDEPSSGAPRDDARRKTNLPEHPPILYGRGADVAAVTALLDEHGLVSIVGAAGIGKTRLALAVAHSLRDAFADGVWIVDLALLSDPSLVPAQALRTLGLQAGESRGSLERLMQLLGDQRLLLILDNCEHVLDEVDNFVAAVRASARNVRVLVTSQEVLRQPDEHVYRLGGLSLPEDMSVMNALDAGAIELFVARAQAVEPRFMLRDNNVKAVIEICRRLDGIPLAIELAAARVPLLGIDGVRERLDERFRLLTAGSRMALRRHQTLRAALEWSYNLLSEPEQVVFEMLGVFAGSFSLECAQRLAADDALDEWAVLDQLGALVDKSLVDVDRGVTPRYRMLETTRAFALERLAARGKSSHAMHRHAEVMLEVFERSQQELARGKPSAKVVPALAPDLDNLRSALRWAAERGGDRRIAIALFGAAIAGHGYFHRVALRLEMGRWSAVLRPLVDDSIVASDAARFWLACAEWNGSRSPALAIDDAKRAIALCIDLGDHPNAFRGWEILAYALSLAGRHDEAKRALEESFALRDPNWPPWLRALNDNIAAIVLGQAGEIARARAHARAMLEVSCEVSTEIDECNAKAILIDLDVAEGNLAQAAATASELRCRLLKASDEFENGWNLRVIATALMSAGRLDEAESTFHEALIRVRRNYENGAVVLYDVALLMALRGRLDDAARVFAYAKGVAEDEGWKPRLVTLRTRDRLLEMLAAKRPADTLARLFDEGRELSDAEASALAFPAA